MQDRYVGDIGDYAKLALLRTLSQGRRLGVLWWRFPDEGHNADGRHIDYLSHPDRWRHFDPEVFDGLGRLVRAGKRDLLALQGEDLLGEAAHFDEFIPTGMSAARLKVEREAWFKRAKDRVSGCDLVFLDPDNGLEPASYSVSAASGGKSVSIEQLRSLSIPGRVLVVYHHQTRMKGGHLAEIDHWTQRLRREAFHTVDVIRARSYSPRAFFLLNAPEDMRDRAAKLAAHWGDRMSWHPGPTKVTELQQQSGGQPKPAPRLFDRLRALFSRT